jgi:phage terminase large subunit-like protein
MDAFLSLTDEQFKKLDPQDQAAVIKYAQDFYADWENFARPEQLEPVGDWYIWAIVSGRGWGKTETGVHWTRKKALAVPETRIAAIGATRNDTRRVSFEGETGFLNLIPDSEIEDYNKTNLELTLKNGSMILGFSAVEPDRFRGSQFHYAWCDELGSWRYPDAWAQLQFCMRLGLFPKILVTTTPRPTAIVRAIMSQSNVHLTRGSTFDNAANLPPSFLEELKIRYEGTRLGRQELYGELLTDTPGAFWTQTVLDETRVRAEDLPELVKRVVSVDPAVTNSEESDETGIIGLGKGIDAHAYVLADRSIKETPRGWALRAVRLAIEIKAGLIIYEGNQGGDAIGEVIRQAMIELADEMAEAGIPRISLKKITASQSKADRALPVSGLYEQGKVHNVGEFKELEQGTVEIPGMITWVPDVTPKSPDRIDALVHGINELMPQIERPKMLYRKAS